MVLLHQVPPEIWGLIVELLDDLHSIVALSQVSS